CGPDQKKKSNQNNVLPYIIKQSQRNQRNRSSWTKEAYACASCNSSISTILLSDLSQICEHTFHGGWSAKAIQEITNETHQQSCHYSINAYHNNFVCAFHLYYSQQI
ncbi:MAG: hypothetical protein EZS28_049888, partial [Streblomastix strix]